MGKPRASHIEEKKVIEKNLKETGTVPYKKDFITKIVKNKN